MISDTASGGATYTRWGRKTCEGNATLVYQGSLYALVHFMWESLHE